MPDSEAARQLRALSQSHEFSFGYDGAHLTKLSERLFEAPIPKPFKDGFGRVASLAVSTFDAWCRLKWTLVKHKKGRHEGINSLNDS